MAAAWIAQIEGGPKRVNHAAVVFRNRIYVVGGYYTGLDFGVREPIDVFMFSLTSCRWSKVVQQGRENAPFMRYGHTTVLYGNSLYLWGGRNDQGACNQLFAFDLVKHSWSKVETYGRRPYSRDGHISCVINHKMYVFGGFIDEPFNVFATGLNALNLKTMMWDQIVSKTSDPECRDFHGAVAVGNEMYIFGGRGTNTPPYHTDDLMYPNTLHVYNTVTKRWRDVPTTAETPPGRRSLSMFARGTDIYIFGGYNALLRVHFNDLHKFNTVTHTWTKIEPYGVGPCPRRRQSCVLVEDRAFLYGGTSPSSAEEEELDEEGESVLVDHSDVFILDLRPTLRTICIVAIIKYKLDFSCLPVRLRDEINTLIDPLSVKRYEDRPHPLA